MVFRLRKTRMKSRFFTARFRQAKWTPQIDPKIHPPHSTPLHLTHHRQRHHPTHSHNTHHHHQNHHNPSRHHRTTSTHRHTQTHADTHNTTQHNTTNTIPSPLPLTLQVLITECSAALQKQVWLRDHRLLSELLLLVDSTLVL